MEDERVIRFLSWNLNMMNTSQEAPSGWRVDQTEALIRQRVLEENIDICLLYTSPSPRDATLSRMPSSA